MRSPLHAFALTALLVSGSLLAVGACGGDAFHGTSGETGGAGGTAGTAAQCSGPESCDDGDNCTTDFCTTEGSCAWASKCPGNRCCNGECAECCDDVDCDDQVSCTQNVCFAGRCMYVPDDTACAAGEFCSVTESCRTKTPCAASDTAESCADSSACTTDSCQNGFCEHEFCAEDGLCCENGCADDCCDDGQCQDDDRDPCTVGSCQDGKCQQVPLCAAGEQCCPSPDGLTASCGSCCSAADCDDGVGCTKDSCTGTRPAAPTKQVTTPAARERPATLRSAARRLPSAWATRIARPAAAGAANKALAVMTVPPGKHAAPAPTAAPSAAATPAAPMASRARWTSARPAAVLTLRTTACATAAPA